MSSPIPHTTTSQYDSDDDVVDTNQSISHNINPEQSDPDDNDIFDSANITLPLKPVLTNVTFDINTTPRHNNKSTVPHYSPVMYNGIVNDKTTVFAKPTQSPRLSASNPYTNSTAYIPQSPAYVYSPTYNNATTAYSPVHPQTPYSPSPHLSPRHTVPQSPRIDTLQSINQRIEQLHKSGKTQQLLRNAAQHGIKLNTVQRNNSVYTPSHKMSNNDKSTSNTALLTIDRYLKRRYIYKVIDIGTVCKAVVYDKHDTHIVINLIDVYQNGTMLNSELNDKPRLSSLSRYDNTTDLLTELDDLNIHITVKAPKLSNDTDIQHNVVINRYRIGDVVKCVLTSVDTYNQTISGSFLQSDCTVDTEHTLGTVKLTTPLLNSSKLNNSQINSTLSDVYTNSPVVSQSQSPVTQQSPYISNVSYSPVHTTNDTKPITNNTTVSNLPYGFPLPNAPRRSKSNTQKNTLLKQIQKSYLFTCINGYDIMCYAYSIPDCTTLLQYQSHDERYNYTTIRTLQNNSWARDSTLKGISYAKRGNFDQCMKCYQHALDINANFVQAYIARGAAYVLMSQSDKAMEQFERALEIEPTNIYAKQYLDDARKKISESNISPRNNSNDTTIEPGEIKPPQKQTHKRTIDTVETEEKQPVTAAQRLKAARLNRSEVT